MKVDKALTKRAQERHARGVKVLDILFGFTAAKAPLNTHTGRALKSRKDRLTWRKWRDGTWPKRVKARRRRRIANESRRRNR